MIDKVIENLYIGDARDVLDECRLRELKITNILTISVEGIPKEKQVDGICYMFIFALDVAAQDMFAGNALANSLNYICASMKNGGRVLVHCEAGISRSVFLVAAFLMQKYQWSVTKAVEHIQRIRPLAQPNDGFMQQLRIFESTNFDADIKTVSHCPLYRNWLLRITASNNAGSEMTHSLVTFDRDKTSSDEADRRTVEYRCRKCRKILFYDDHIIKHTTSTVQTAVDRTTEAAVCGFRYLVLPMKWMSLTEYQGKIFCPSCGEKLGHYIWGGRVCDGISGRPCGAAVRPWTYVNQNKVDRVVKANNTTASPAAIVINKPPSQASAQSMTPTSAT